eukprot:TRINITY_DN15047_c0_g1_i1.p1 TRINITY_DN15047_c0_g1~~TRINITY_DN15047_c0_g1_i1.p1  ORF type:complete len:872 (+),score=147.73 TRINITY_DN15047_c0_g1_i1:50-2665(+)
MLVVPNKKKRHIFRNKNSNNNIKDLQDAYESVKYSNEQASLFYQLLLDDPHQNSEPLMRTLVAVQDSQSRNLLNETLVRRGHQATFILPQDLITNHLRQPCSMMIFEDICETSSNPTLDGLALCRHVRSVCGESVVILLLTDQSKSAEISRILDAGANDYLHTPSIFADPALLEVRLMSAERQILSLSRLRNHDKVAALSRKLLGIIEFSSDIVLVLDRQGRNLYANSRMSEATGFARAQLLGKEFMMFLPKLDEYHLLWTTVNSGKSWRGPLTIQHVDGSLVRYEATVSPSPAFVGDTSFLVMMRDVSQVPNQTSAGSEKISELLRDREIGRMRVLSYQVLTLLSDIIGLSDILTDEQNTTGLSAIGAAANRLQSLLKGMIEFFTLESGKVVLQPSVFDPRVVLEAAVEAAQQDYRTHTNEVFCLVAREVPQSLAGDSGRFLQLVKNLITHALMVSSPGGEISIWLNYVEEALDLVLIKLEIRGNWPLSSFSVFPSFAEIASRSCVGRDVPSPHNTREISVTDHDIDLAICKIIVEVVFHGEIGVESRLGLGSSIWANLKFNLPQKQIGASPSDPPTKLPTDGTNLNSLSVLLDPYKRIIIADGSLARRTLIQTELTGVEILAVESVAQAAATANGEGLTWDLLILEANQDLSSLPTLVQNNAGIRILLTHAAGTSQNEAIRIGDELARQIQTVHIFTLVRPLRQSLLREAVNDAMQRPATDLPHSGENKLETPSPPQLKTDASSFAGVSILLVDDNVVNRQVGKRMLEKLGCAVDFACNGSEAVTKATGSGVYSLVLMDLEMPVMNGYDATIEIRKEEEKSNSGGRIPIIAMTAYLMLDSRCYQVGMDDYLSKPFSSNDLLVLLKKWVK